MCQKLVLPVLGIPLFAYGFMILLGFLLASYLCQREAERRGLSRERILDFGVLEVLAGVIGARIFFVVQFWDESFSGEPWYSVFAIWQGGLVFYGGFLAAIIVGAWYLWRHKLPVLKVLDTCAPFVPIGMAFGRLGCWLNGCCWGGRCSSSLPAFFTRFPHGSPAQHSQHAAGLIGEVERTLPVHPTQLYDSFHSFLLCGLLWWYLRKNPADGAVTFVFITMYGIGRFSLEGLRGDHQMTFTGLTVSQNLSIAIAVLGVIGIGTVRVLRNRLKGLKFETP